MRILALALALVVSSLPACGDDTAAGTGGSSATGAGGSTTSSSSATSGSSTTAGSGSSSTSSGDGGSGGATSSSSGDGGSGGATSTSSGAGAGNAFGTISWTADGAPITTATFNNPAYDPVTVPAAGRASFTLLAATDDFQEQMSFILFYAAGETIPAGTYTCGALPNAADSVTVTVAHLAVVGQAKDDAVGPAGECSITFDDDVTIGGQVSGSFTVTAPRAGGGGPDIEITEGVFEVTDP